MPEPLETRVALHPFLAGMKPAHLAILTECARPARFENGEIILREGEFADRFFLIESGAATIESGADLRNRVVVDWISSGDLLGWSWMFPPYAWRFTARAATEMSLLSFRGPILRERCGKSPALGYMLVKRAAAIMLRRLQAARDRIAVRPLRMSRSVVG